MHNQIDDVLIDRRQYSSNLISDLSERLTVILTTSWKCEEETGSEKPRCTEDIYGKILSQEAE
jgi:hypothetical protein